MRLRPRASAALCLLLPLFLCRPAQAQSPAQGDAAAPPVITASAGPGGARFAALGAVDRLRLEVYDASGVVQLYDSGLLAGNVRDWPLSDRNGARLPDGAYVYVLTARDASGVLSIRQGRLLVEGGRAALSLGEATRPAAPAPETQPAPPQEGRAGALALTAHDGADALFVRSRGALSFRLGDFFAGEEKEQMRLTEGGDLELEGAVRAAGGFKFADGTTLSSEGGRLKVTSESGDELPGPTAAGTGTVNRLAKWAETGGSGTLTDAAGAETGGMTFFGQNASGQVAPLFAQGPTYHVLEVGASGTKSPLTLAGGSGVMEFWKDLGGGAGAPQAAVSFGMAKPGTAASNDMVFSTYLAQGGWNERLRLTNGGRVGVGTASPGAALHVVGPSRPTVATGSGADALPVLQVVGGNGGSTTDQVGHGGAGAGMLIQAGNGGGVPYGSDMRGGRGGSITIQPGTAGPHGGSFLELNSHGNLYLTPANGGQYGGNVWVGPSDADPGNDHYKLHVTGHNHLLRVAQSFSGQDSGPAISVGAYGDFQMDAAGVQAGRFVVKENGRVGIGTNAPQAQFHASNNAAVGPFGVGQMEGRLNVSGSNAELSFTRRSLASWPGSPAAGDRFAWYNPDGTARLWSNGDLLTVTATGRLGIGTSPGHKLHVIDSGNTGLRVQNDGTGGTIASFGGNGQFQIDGPFCSACRFVVRDDGKVGFGTPTPSTKMVIRQDVQSGLGPVLTLLNGGALTGAGAAIDFNGYDAGADPSSARIQSIDEGNFSSALTFWTKAPGASANALVERLRINSGGTIRINNLGASGSTALCLNASSILSACSSSIRYKENVSAFVGGLDVLRRLRPVAFDWQDGAGRDLGFVAEEVGRVEPLLVTRNAAGEVEGVKYDRLSTVLVNAVREQQQQLAAKDTQLARQGARLAGLEARLTALERLVDRGGAKARRPRAGARRGGR